MKNIIIKIIQRRIIEKWLNYFPLSKIAPTDIIIAGFPKSGNTWFQHLLASIVFGCNGEYTPDTLVQELIPDVHFKNYFRRYSEVAYFKSHYLPKPEYKKVIFLIRDGRDAMVSYYHYNKKLGYDTTLTKMVREGDTVFPCMWHIHIQKWLENPYKADMIFVRYEDLLNDPLAEMKKVCKFINIERSDAYLEQSIATCSFDKMSKREKEQGWEGWNKEKTFLRSGKIGDYKKEMIIEDTAFFNQMSAQVLKHFNYEI